MRRGPTMRMTVGSVVITWSALSGSRPFQTFADAPKAREKLLASNDLDGTRLGRNHSLFRVVSGGRA